MRILVCGMNTYHKYLRFDPYCLSHPRFASVHWQFFALEDIVSRWQLVSSRSQIAFDGRFTIASLNIARRPSLPTVILFFNAVVQFGYSFWDRKQRRWKIVQIFKTMIQSCMIPVDLIKMNSQLSVVSTSLNIKCTTPFSEGRQSAELSG